MHKWAWGRNHMLSSCFEMCMKRRPHLYNVFNKNNVFFQLYFNWMLTVSVRPSWKGSVHGEDNTKFMFVFQCGILSPSHGWSRFCWWTFCSKCCSSWFICIHWKKLCDCKYENAVHVLMTLVSCPLKFQEKNFLCVKPVPKN